MLKNNRQIIKINFLRLHLNISKIKSFFALIFATVLIVLCCGCVNNEPSDFARVANIKASGKKNLNNIRYEALKQTSRELGAQAGLAWRSQQLNRVLERDKVRLGRIFNFSYLILNDNVLPPILTEGRNILNLDDDQNIRVADQYYKIVAQPRFITTPPNWRNYLWMSFKKPELPNVSLLPKNHNEAIVWNKFIRVGWNEGVIQANQIFATNVNRLTRDFVGMVLYRKLLAQKMVSAPYVAQADLGVTGGGDDMRINDRVLRITSSSALQSDSKQWQPVISE